MCRNFGSSGRAAAVVAGMFTLAACSAVGPDFQRPQTAAPAQWRDWHGGDPALAAPVDGAAATRATPPGALPWEDPSDATLAALLARAEQGNADLRTAALRFEQARVAAGIATSQQSPQVGARAGASRSRLSETGASTRVVDAIGSGAQREHIVQFLSTPYSVFQAGFDASWEVDLWGRVRRSVESAQAQSAQGESLLAQARLVLRAEVARGYFLLRASQRERTAAEDDLGCAQQALDIRVAQVRRGLVDDDQRLRASQDVSAAQSRATDAVAAEAAALDRLSLLVGERPGALDALLAAPVDDDPSTSVDLDLASLDLGAPADFLGRRPDVAAAQARLAAATADIGVAIADLYPRLSLAAGTGLESIHGSTFVDWGSRNWTIGPSLSLPVFDAGRRRATVELRRLDQQQAAIAFQQAVLQAWHDVDGALSGYAAALADRRAASQRRQDAQAALATALARASRGLTDELAPLSARRVLAQARFAEADARGRVAVQRVALGKALGAGPASPLESRSR